MLIVPAEHSLDWKRFPWVTLLLIVINTLIFFGYQSGDEARQQVAVDTYLHGQLPERERALYQAYVKASGEEAADDGDERPRHRKRQHLPEEDEGGRSIADAALAMAVLTDLDFEASLHARDDYRHDNDWQSARQAAEAARDRISFYRFGFIPGKPSWQGLLGASFLHGGVDHLLGNMIFLFIFGFSLEVTLGAGRYLGLYLLAGTLSHAFWWALSSTLVPGVGASGAIAGLMGMYLAVYGMRRIRFFYWIAVFFGFFTAPAVLMLPVWISKELWGLWLEHGHINYYVHIGGLLSGYALVAGGRLLGWLPMNTHYLEKKDPDAVLKKELVALERSIGMLDIERATTQAQALMTAYPQDCRVLELVWALLKSTPEHVLARTFLKQLLKLPLTEDSKRLWQQLAEALVAGTSGGSKAVSVLPLLQDPRVQWVLLPKLIELRMSAPALALWRQFCAHRTPLPQWPALSLRLGKLLGQEKNMKAVEEVTAALCKAYPQAEESRLLYDYRQYLRG